MIGDSTINTLALQRAPCEVFRKRNMNDMVLLSKIIHHTMISSLLYIDHEKLLSCVQLFATPWTVTYQAPLSMGFYRQEYWSGLPFPSPGDLPNPGIEPWSPALQADTLPSEPSYHSSKASILWCSAFFIVQLSHQYMTTGKTIALTRWTFVSNVMSLLFNMLPRLVITFLPRSKCLLILWLQSPSAEILEPPKI